MAKTTGALRERLRAVATEAMLDAAERLMIQRGYERATMQEIATEAGCAIGTFYLYFKNKEEIFEAILGRHARVVFGGAREAMAQQQDPLEKVRAGKAAIMRYTEEHQEFFRLFTTALPLRQRAMHERLGGEARQEHDAYSAVELEALKEAQRLGRIRADLPAEILQQFMEAVCMNIAEQFRFAAEAPPLDEQMRVLWGLITGGIGARSGEHASA